MGEVLLAASVLVFVLIVYLLNIYIPQIEQRFKRNHQMKRRKVEIKHLRINENSSRFPLNEILKNASRKIDLDANVEAGYNYQYKVNNVFGKLSSFISNIPSPLPKKSKNTSKQAWFSRRKEILKENLKVSSKVTLIDDKRKVDQSKITLDFRGNELRNSIADCKEFYSNNKTEIQSTNRKIEENSTLRKRIIRHKFFETPFGGK